MKLYRSRQGIVAEHDGILYAITASSWDELIVRENLGAHLAQLIRGASPLEGSPLGDLHAPIGGQDVWAAGVTYYRSRNARMEESRAAGGGDFYDRVYAAERPELFFKATARSVVGPRSAVRIRSDARWSVPEPELTLLINPRGAIVGYTIGNDMSSRDIEGENPLYLPQAKVYDGSCALGPCVLLTSDVSRDTAIRLEILRAGQEAF